MSLDPNRPRTYGLLGSLRLINGDYDQAVAFGEKALSLNPNGADITAYLAITSTYTGELERSISLIKQAMRLSPYYPEWYQWILGRAYRLSGQYDKAIATLTARRDDSPDSFFPHIELAAVYSEMGRHEAARAEADEVLRINPRFSVREWTRAPQYKDPAITEREIRTLRRAGLPE